MAASYHPSFGKNIVRGCSAVLLTVAVFFCGMGISEGHGSYHAVVAKLEKALAKNPDDASVRFQLAKAHSEHEEWKLCLDELERVDALARGKFATGWLRGVSFHQGGMNGKAKDELDRFLAGQPEHAAALLDRAKVSEALGDKRGAAEDSTRALALAPSSAVEQWVFAADCLTADDRRDDAVRLLETALKHHDKDPLLLREVLSLETELQRWDDALGRIDDLGKVSPSPEPWMAERAELLVRAGRPDESKRSWQALLDHLSRLPNLDRGTPRNLELAGRARAALGIQSPLPVTAPPASSPKASSP